MQDTLYSYVRQHHYPLYIAGLLTKDKVSRDYVMAIFALRCELHHIVAITREPMTGFVRLVWWRDRIHDLYAGKRPENHCVLEGLNVFIQDRQPPKALFDALLRACEAQLEKQHDITLETEALIKHAVDKEFATTIGFIKRYNLEKSMKCGRFSRLLLPLKALLYGALTK